MLDKLRKQINVELEEMDILLAEFDPLLREIADGKTPNRIELAALATFIHSWYNGVENIFKRITILFDKNPPRGSSWHRELLERVSKPIGKSGSVISESLKRRLEEYMEFRHLFRHAYVVRLNWQKMSCLVRKCQDTFNALKSEINSFLSDQ